MKATTSPRVGLLGLTVIVLAIAGPAAAYTGQATRRQGEDHHRTGARDRA